MENSNPTNGNNLSAKAQEEINSITEEEARKAQWQSEMMASPAVRAYLDKYEQSSVQPFLDNYLSQKNAWVQYGDMYANMKEDEELRFDNEAQEYLKVIQQKKLFDLQCLWRAGKIELPGIQLTYNFLLWQEDILNCPFIDAITEEDIALCKEYLLEGNVDVDEDWMGLEWQEYTEVKAGYDTNNEQGWYPAWYEFVDSRKGTHNMSLPDIKGPKESFYRHLYIDSQKDIREAHATAHKKAMEARKPSLSTFDDEATADLIKIFERKDIQNKYKAFTWGTSDLWERENMESMMNLLRSADEPVPIEAHDNWIEALQQAVFKYKCKKIAEALPRAWEQYTINIQAGIAFPKEEENLYVDFYESIYKQIIAGRKLNGEPEDLNF